MRAVHFHFYGNTEPREEVKIEGDNPTTVSFETLFNLKKKKLVMDTM